MQTHSPHDRSLFVSLTRSQRLVMLGSSSLTTATWHELVVLLAPHFALRMVESVEAALLIPSPSLVLMGWSPEVSIVIDKLRAVSWLCPIVILGCPATFELSATHPILVIPAPINPVEVKDQIHQLCSLDDDPVSPLTAIAHQLRLEQGQRIIDYLRQFLAIPHRLNALNAHAWQANLLDFDHLELLKSRFLEQMRLFPEVSYIQAANPAGHYCGIGRLSSGSYYIEIKLDSDSPDKQAYSLNEADEITGDVIGISKNYDPRQRQWYELAAQSPHECWSPIYQYSSTTLVELGIMAVKSLWSETSDSPTLAGVLGVDLTPAHISCYLQQLDLPGSIYIVDAAGKLVASSTQEPVVGKSAGVATQIAAQDSSLSHIRQSMRSLLSTYGDLNTIQDICQLDYFDDGNTYYAHVLPFQSEIGLSWWVVLVISQTQLFASINWQTSVRVQTAYTALERANQALQNQIEAQKSAIQALEKSPLRSDRWLSVISHELRSPLMNLHLALHILPNAHDRAQYYNDIALAECKREIALIENLLTLQELDAGTLHSHLEIIDLTDWLTQITCSFKPLWNTQKQTFTLKLSSPSPSLLHIDRFCVERIVRELLRNATTYTPVGGTLNLKVTLKKTTLTLSLSNSASIDPADQAHVFEAFYRGANAQSTRGAGLGLLVARCLAQAAKGRIKLKSTPDSTCFTLTLPCIAPAGEAKTTPLLS